MNSQLCFQSRNARSFHYSPLQISGHLCESRKIATAISQPLTHLPLRRDFIVEFTTPWVLHTHICIEIIAYNVWRNNSHMLIWLKKRELLAICRSSGSKRKTGWIAEARNKGQNYRFSKLLSYPHYDLYLCKGMDASLPLIFALLTGKLILDYRP